MKGITKGCDMEAANYDNGRLKEYLGYKFWQPESGLRVIVGLDYFYKSAFEDMPLGSLPDGAKRTADGTRLLWETHQMLNTLGELARAWHGEFVSYDKEKEKQTPKFFIEWALEKDFRPEWLDWAIEQGLYKPADVPAAKVEAGADATSDNAVKPVRGITKNAVIGAFTELRFNNDQWAKYLGDPPQWLEVCRVAKGSKKVSATWNPALIAAGLYDKGISIKKLDAVFVSLQDWADEWKEKSASLRD
ncbi:MAG: hypothetical protein ABL860_02965 [Candidatus Nitrotoga sp.]